MPDDLSGAIAQFTPRLRAFAFSLVNDEAEADDLVQETCLRAIGARDRFVPGTNLKAWLFPILRNLHRNRRRDLAVRPSSVGFEEVAEHNLADERPISSVERRAVARADVEDMARVFRTLPPAFAVPLHLVAVEDLSYRQVAAILDIPIGTVMSRVYRARRLLMARLAGGD